MAIDFKPLSTWDAQADKDFSKLENAAFLKREYEMGLCAIFAVVDNRKRVGSILFCSETKPNGEKVFAVTAASTMTRRSLIEEGKGLISDYARKTGHRTVKFYTRRARLAEKFVAMGARAKITWDV